MVHQSVRAHGSDGASRLRLLVGVLTAAVLAVGATPAPAQAGVVDHPAPTVASVEPRVAAPGDVVTVRGSGFDDDEADNVVTVGPVWAEVVDATATTLTFVVPQMQASGKVRVRTEHGVNRLTADLFVAPAPYPFAEVGDTGRIRLGGRPVTVGTTTTPMVAIVMVDAQAGQHLSVDLSAATFSGSASLVAPDGTQVATTLVDPAGTTSLAARARATGSYTILLGTGPEGGGEVTVSAAAPPAGTETIALDEAVPISIDTARRNVVRYLDLEAGQLIGVDVASSTFAGVTVLVTAPDGTPVVRAMPTGPDHFDPTAVAAAPVTGRYAVVVDPVGEATGSLTLTVRLVPPTVVVPLDAGVEEVATVTAPGQAVQLTFEAEQGDHVLLELAGAELDGHVIILPPSGAGLRGEVQLTAGTDAVWDSEPAEFLPETGTYTATITPTGRGTGSVTALLTVLDDPVAAWTVDGPPETIVVAEPYQNVRRTLVPAAGQMLAFTLTDSAFPAVTLHLISADGAFNTPQTIEGPSGSVTFGAFEGGEEYTVIVNPHGPATGSLTLDITDVTS